MLTGLTIIFGFLFLGDLIKEVLNLPIPGNVLGMILLFFSLIIGFVPLKSVEKPSSLLLGVMGIFFVPAGVGIIDQLQTLKRFLVPALLAITLSTLITLIFTGYVFKFFYKKKDGKRE